VLVVGPGHSSISDSQPSDLSQVYTMCIAGPEEEFKISKGPGASHVSFFSDGEAVWGSG
jgi:hypothetical protein